MLDFGEVTSGYPHLFSKLLLRESHFRPFDPDAETDPFCAISCVERIFSLRASFKGVNRGCESRVFMVNAPDIELPDFNFHMLKQREKDGSPCLFRQSGSNSDFES